MNGINSGIVIFLLLHLLCQVVLGVVVAFYSEDNKYQCTGVLLTETSLITYSSCANLQVIKLEPFWLLKLLLETSETNVKRRVISTQDLMPLGMNAIVIKFDSPADFDLEEIAEKEIPINSYCILKGFKICNDKEKVYNVTKSNAKLLSGRVYQSPLPFKQGGLFCSNRTYHSHELLYGLLTDDGAADVKSEITTTTTDQFQAYNVTNLPQNIKNENLQDLIKEREEKKNYKTSS